MQFISCVLHKFTINDSPSGKDLSLIVCVFKHE